MMEDWFAAFVPRRSTAVKVPEESLGDEMFSRRGAVNRSSLVEQDRATESTENDRPLWR